MTKSKYADRDTIGTMSLAARLSNDIPVAGDLGHELMPSLVEDLNNTIASNPYNDRPFYIVIHEKKDLQLKNTILRRMIAMEKRPYPEPNTTVFKTLPKANRTDFCWSLPHNTLFEKVLCNPDRHAKDQINDIKAYQAEDLLHFGFTTVGKTKNNNPIYTAIPGFIDRKLGKPKTKKANKISLILP